MTHRRSLLSWVVSGLVSSTLTLAQPTSDTTPPQLVSLSFTPTSVDVSATGQTVVVTARITDDLSGLNYAYLRFVGPNNQSIYGYFYRSSGTALDGVYSADVSVPRFVASGTWKAAIYMFDSAGNQLLLQATTLQSLGFATELTIVDTVPDVAPPTLLGVSFSPSTIDVSSEDVDVTIQLQISDNLSGVDVATYGNYTVILAPIEEQLSTTRQYVATMEFTLVSGTALNGIWQAVKRMPRSGPAGEWQIQQVFLMDAASNSIYLGPTQLAASGITSTLSVVSSPSDVTDPTLTGLGFSPALINTSLAAQTVAITLSASDDLSGVDFTPTTPNIAQIQVGFVSPSGNQWAYVNPFTAPQLDGGTPLAGSWLMSLTWPQYSEEGTWKLQYLSLKDRTANQVNYTPAMLEAMGLPDSIIVIKPSLGSDGSVGPGGGTVEDSTFGSRASVTLPANLAPSDTSVSIDVFTSPLAVPTPRGFTAPGTYFVNLSFEPALASPLPAPGITLVLPLPTPLTPGAQVTLFHIDPVTGTLAPAMNAFGQFVKGTVNADTQSATFLNVVTVSTVVGYLSNGSVLGDVNGDGLVNCADVSLIKASFGKRTGQAGFNSAADLNNDGVVDIKDLFIVSRQLPAGTACH